jgi:polysaccharide export outer membrane protein
VVVKQINSLSVSIVGQVGKPAQYALLRPMTVVELISQAGGVAEYAQTKNIRITRTENGKPVSKVFNYKDFLKGKPEALQQNIVLKPGDIVTVP